jgi:hypothetical protein
MSQHVAFRRTAVQGQMQLQQQTTTLPAANRGIIANENYTFMQPGGALVCDNWMPTMRGVKLRGGTKTWCQLPETTPVTSGFEYLSGNLQKIFAANASKIYDVTTTTPALVASGQASGNYATAQLANQSGNYLIAVNDAGDFPLRFDGTSWTTLNAGQINGPAGSNVANGKNLVYVWKYKNRLFFIEASSMNAWCLPVNAIQGTLIMIPLGGAATKGGKLLFGASWSIDAGDGIDNKCVFGTDQGELIIFTGSDPTDANNWHQQGRYATSPPLGMNAHMPIGGDLLIATVDGIIPISQTITKDASQMELAAVTRTIKSMWRDEVLAKRALPWTMKKWDEYGAVFVTLPGGQPGSQYCLVSNAVTGAWCRFVGYDAYCWMYMHGQLYYGNSTGKVIQCEINGNDDGLPYVATLVGGWEMFQQTSATITWLRARASFTSNNNDPFQPQLAACTDYVIRIPTPPNAGPDPGLADVWDQGLWDHAKWDQPYSSLAPVRNTGWVSIGETGFSHAPIVQVTVAQQAKPNVELISIAATYVRMGIDV